MDLRQEKTNYIENATPEELKEVANMDGFVKIPLAEWERLIKDSEHLKMLLNVYRKKGETYHLEGILNAILDFREEKTVKQIKEMMLDLDIKIKMLKGEQEKANTNKVATTEVESDGVENG